MEGNCKESRLFRLLLFSSFLFVFTEGENSLHGKCKQTVPAATHTLYLNKMNLKIKTNL